MEMTVDIWVWVYNIIVNQLDEYVFIKSYENRQQNRNDAFTFRVSFFV